MSRLRLRETMGRVLSSRVRAVIGLATLGQGLLILTRVVPHESLLVGGLLGAGGVVLLWRANMPQLDRVPARLPIATGGLAIALGVLAYNAWRTSTLDAPKLVIVGLALASSAAALFHDRRIRGVPLASALLWSVPLAWGPLTVWAAQGAMKTAWNATPLEAFTHYGLLLPLAGALSILGRNPTLEGPVVTYLTPSGPIALEVGVACSGIQAMALFGGILLALLLVERPTLRVGLAWCAIGLGGVYLVNVVRLVSLALVGSRWGIDALVSFHANAGWMFFLLWSAAFAVIVIRPGARRVVPR